MPATIKKNMQILSWAFYDLANQFFALNIISLYFVRWLVIVKKVPEIYYSIAFAVSVLLVAVLSPVLGAVSDGARRHRLFLIVFTLLSVFFTVSLGNTQQVGWALVFFALANLGCQLAAVFYNALLVHVAPPGHIGFVSGFGRMFGYAGAALSLWIIKPFVLKYGYQATFAPTGLMFLIFALPCMVLVKDKNPAPLVASRLFRRDYVLGVFRSLKGIFLKTYHDRQLFSFFQSIFFSLAAVNVVILFMSVYVTQVFHLDEGQMIRLIGFAVFFCIGGSVISGWLSDRIGYRASLMAVYGLWILCFVAGALIPKGSFYDVIGAGVGLVLGATWVVVRAAAVNLVSSNEVGEMFGLFNAVGYGSAIMGALFWGLMVTLMSSWGAWRYRLALLSLSGFMILGIYFLRKVRTNGE